MATKSDKSLKHKQKREEKQRVRKGEERKRREILETEAQAQSLLFRAEDAFAEGKKDEALDLACKGFNLAPDLEKFQDVRSLAIKIKNWKAVYDISRVGYDRGYLSTRGDILFFAELSMIHKDFAQARSLMQEALAASSRYAGQLTAKFMADAARLLKRCNGEENLHILKTQLRPIANLLQPTKATGRKPQASRAANQAVTPAAKAKVAQAPPPPSPVATPKKEEPFPALEIVFNEDPGTLHDFFRVGQVASLEHMELALSAYDFSFMTSYDQLISLVGLHNVQSFWHQEETARKIMKSLRGRALLADEVGLGKTIEACIVLKEYQQRGLVRSALILAPSSLIGQWRSELRDKFGLEFATSQDPLFRQDPELFWRQPLLLVSLPSARSKTHYAHAVARSWDILVVDEAHHLKNRTTLNWKLVNELQKTFVLLLTATPVQNKLEELFNLITLLKPGHLKTQKAFKDEFVARGDPCDPKNREKLRELLKEVMVRNTRSVAKLNLPPRYASTIRIEPSKAELDFYQGIDALIAEQSAAATPLLSKIVLRKLLEAAGSSHFAAARMLEKLRAASGDRAVTRLIELSRSIGSGAKLRRIVELIQASSGKKIVFVNYRATLEHLHALLTQKKMPHAMFHGSMSQVEKAESMARFRDSCPVLLATESGGEGHNLQFCQTLINCDLPWNPMRIEQRIGRIHRIGQEKEVHVYNFCAAGSIEDYILDILDRKINMFELVIGEMDMILGSLQGENEFSDMVYELWLGNTDEQERKKAFDGFGAQLKRARATYQKSKELDEKLFREDFGV